MTHKPFVAISQAEKLSIKQIVHDDGWSKRILCDNQPHLLELKPETYQNGYRLVLIIDGNRHFVWAIHEQPIKHHQLRNGGFVPWDRSSQWLIIGGSGKRHRSIYLVGTEFGTRTDFRFPFRYPSQYGSRQSRAAYSHRYDRRRARKRRKLERRLAAYKKRIGVD
jgi:hypothetical protein